MKIRPLRPLALIGFLGLMYVQAAWAKAAKYDAGQPISADQSNIDQARTHIFALRLAQGHKILSQLRPQPYTILLANQADALELWLTEDPKAYKLLENNQKIRLDQLSNFPNNSAYYLHSKGQILFDWAIVELRFGNHWAAAWQLRQCLKIVKQNVVLYPDFLPSQRTLALLEIGFGCVPTSYQWILAALGVQTKLETGLKRLEKVALGGQAPDLENSAFQAKIWLSIIDLYLLEEPSRAAFSLETLYQQSDKSLLLCLLSGLAQSKSGQGPKALETLTNHPKGPGYLPLFWINLLLGDLFLQSGQYQRSLIYLKYFQKNYEGQNYLKDSYYKCFLAYWLETSTLTEQAIEARKQIGKVGNEQAEPDRYAQRQYKNSQNQQNLPHVLTLKLRLATDGGFYALAYQVLNQAKSKPIAFLQQCEWVYRKARLLHKTDSLAQATALYMQVIENCDAQKEYFPASAALQLGILYLHQNRPTQAKHWLNKAANMPTPEYKNSIRQKAKALLENNK